MAADGSITAVVDLDVNDAEKRVEQLRKRIIKLQDNIKINENKKSYLIESLEKTTRELSQVNKKISSGIASQQEIDRTSELQQKIKDIESQLIKIDTQSEKWNTELQATNELYGQAEKEANRLRGTQEKITESAEQQASSYGNIGDQFEEQAQKIEQARQDIEAAVDRVKSVLGSMPDVAERMFPGINEAFDSIIRKAQETFEKVKESAKEALPEQVTSDMEQLSESFKLVFSRLSESVPEFLKDYAAHVLAAVRTIKENLPSSLGDLSQSIISGLQNILPQINDALEKGGIAEVGKQALSGILDVISSISPKVAIAIEALKLLGYTFQKLWAVAVKESVMLANGIKTAFTGVVSTVKEAPNAIKKFVNAASSGLKKVSKVFREITNSIVSFLKNINIVSKLSEKLNRVFNKLGSTIRRVFVYSTLTSFFRALRTQVSDYLSLNAEFMTALGRLKSALATAFQPILDVIIPALTALVNMLTQVISVVAQFIAALFGTTAKRAQANAKALNDQAKATEAAGNAAEKASQQLAPFDEINSLSYDKGGGSSGGGGGGGAELGDALFDLDFDDTAFKTWGEAFDAFLDHILEEGIPAFRKAMEEFAGWINWFSENLLEMFTFPGVKDKMHQIGVDIADVLNEFMDLVDFELLGNAIGAGIDDIVALLNGFFDNLDTKKAGKSLAEFINGLTDYVDWEKFGRLLSRGIESGLKILAGFLENLDMPDLANAVSKTIEGFFDNLRNALANDIEWKKIGNQIATFFNNLDWYGIITSAAGAIAAGVNGFFTMLREFIDELHWDDIAKQIGNAINDSLDMFDWKLIATTLGDAIEKVLNFLKTIIDVIAWHDIGKIIGNAILDFDFVSALGALADLIASAINAAVQLVCGLLDIIEPEAYNIGNGISERIRNAVNSVEWGELGNVVGRAIKTALSFVAGLLDEETFYAIGKAIGEFFINLDWPGILEGLGKAIANGIKSAVALIRGFLDVVQPNLKQLATDIADKINNFVHSVDWKELARTINEGINTALDFLLDILGQLDWDSIAQAIVDFLTELDWPGLLAKWQLVMSTAIGSALREIDLKDALSLGLNIVGGLLEGMQNKWNEYGGISGFIKKFIFEKIIDAFKSLFGIHSPSTVMDELGGYLIEGLIQGITNAWNGIVEFFAGALEELVKTIGEAWENIKTAAGEAWENIKTAISDAWENIKTAVNNAIDEVKKKIDDIWENIKNTTADIWDEIKRTISQTWENIKKAVSDTIDEVKRNIDETWENIKKTTSEIWENVSKAISDTWENIKKAVADKIAELQKNISDTWDNIKKTAYDIWENGIKKTISDAWENIKTAVNGKIGELKKNIVDAWENVKTEAGNKWNEIKKAISDKWSEINTAAVDKFKEIKQSVIDKISELKSFDWFSIGKNIVDGILNGLNSIWNSLKNFARDVKDTISGAISGAKTAASNALNSITGRTYTLPTSNPIAAMGEVTIPRLAAGAIIPPNREFAAILGDQSSGNNLEAPEGLIRKIVREESGGGNEQIVSLLEALLSAVKAGKTMVADGKAIAKVVTNEQNRMTRMSGKSILLG